MSGACSSNKPRARPALVLAAGVLAVLVLLLVALAAPRRRDHDAFLSGFWAGDPSFLEEAGLSQLDLFIAPPSDKRGAEKRQGYLLMVDEKGEVLSNQRLEIARTAGRGPAAWKAAGLAALAPPGPCDAGRVLVSYEDAPAMPEDLALKLDCTRGTLVLHAGGEVYAALYKDNAASAAANSEYLAAADGGA